MRKLIIKQIYSALIALTFLTLISCETLNNASKMLNSSGLVTPTITEMGLGIKEALQAGTILSAESLGTKDGYFGNLAVKILFPSEAQKVEKALRNIGLGLLADDVILSINRAAEDAVVEAKPIFIAAIKQMTIADASNILLSNQSNAATQYFKKVTYLQLQNKFKPVIQASLTKVGATRYWANVINKYNQIPFVNPVNPSLENYVTQKAIDGLFAEIAKEELKIRNNIGARNGALLQKVFGYADRIKNNKAL